ncbi:hypothetical protein LIER_11655 [Lithospermum erythrorhizon]|uniref:Protein ROOT INITIATION DEFECTIVE 3-like n=1 Tax=Lithospermum erythrorhizon TaxID=34254 RepID=A0AAV3PSW0_LITER
MEAEIVLASSPTDAGISCWDLHSGAEHLRHRTCSATPHGLVSVANNFLASSQLRDSKNAAGSIFYWSWNKPQVEVKSFPSEVINPLVANSEGTYIIGGGVSGHLFLWEVATGKLLKKWHAHYRAVTCLVFGDDQSLLISGAEDGCVRIWSLISIFDDMRREKSKHLYEYSFSDHSLKVTDIVTGYGGCNAIIVSASEDRTCKVWSISKGKCIRNIVFPSVIDAVAMDPGEHVFYAGARNGKIYIAALNAQCPPTKNYALHIIGSLSERSKAITCLASSMDGIHLVSGSEDGMIRVWDTTKRNIIRIFRHAKGPINNILILRQPPHLNPSSTSGQSSSAKKHGYPLPPPLGKYTDSSDENTEIKAFIGSRTPNYVQDASYRSSWTMMNQIKELRQQGSSAASELEMERLKFDSSRSMQMIQQWKKKYENLYQYCVGELLEREQVENVQKRQK